MVEQGQMLVRLDDTQARAVYDVHRSQLLGDEALSARDLAELAGAAAISFPRDLTPDDPVAAAVMNRERIVFRSHRRVAGPPARRGGPAHHPVPLAGGWSETATRNPWAGNWTLAAQEHAVRRGVAEGRTGAEEPHAGTGRGAEVAARPGGAVDRPTWPGSDRQAVELQAEKLRLRQAAQDDATHELRDAQLRINDVLPRLAADRDMLRRLEIRAPISGEVVNLAIFTKGGVIEPGKPIMDIVPRAPTMVAEAQIRPEDVEHLRVGQAAEVMATGFSLRDASPIEGKVTVISADRMTDPRTRTRYFKAEMALVADRQGGALLRRLGPGMPVQVIVPTKARTAFDYLVGPLRQSFRGALREM